MERLAAWCWRRFGDRYFTAYAVFEAVSALAITVGALGLLTLYERVTDAQFLRMVLFSCACVAVSLVVGTGKASRIGRPLLEWARGPRGREGAPEAWRSAISLPIQFVTKAAWLPVALVALPVSIYITVELALPAYSSVALFLGALVSVAYAAVLHFFAAELALRPVVHDIAMQLPHEFAERGSGVPLRWKLLGALPLINVITGVIVSGLSAADRASLSDLGLDVIVAVLVAFTISFELTLLLTRSVLSPVRELVDATERVKAGDLSARVAVTSGDEIGQLALSFNEMLTGLDERERLRAAFGSYVSPDVAERVMAEGELLEGEDVEVTVMFVDIRDFTPFAERSTARETVAYLNDFFGLVVPVLERHGGHANKFIGDGVMGVFGAPDRSPDHPSRALAAACEIAEAVERRYKGSLRVGIGLNSGPASVGSVGGGGRLEFTVIGDTVNVAARVEHLTRATGDTVLLTEATRCLLDGKVEVEPRGEVPLKGKRDLVPVYVPVRVGAAHFVAR
ncbi:MAG: adenylate cyclase [Thermoleophilaceae bacterium]|nr:adenylate cyclase [Thermoleophilaceae bacterium]